jgi:hypothetical protein
MKRTELVVKTYGTFDELSDEQKERIVAMEADDGCRHEHFWNYFSEERIKNYEEEFDGTGLVVKVKNFDLDRGAVELSLDVASMEGLLDYFGETEGYRRLRILSEWKEYNLVRYGHESGADYYYSHYKPLPVFGGSLEFGPNGVMIMNDGGKDYIFKNKDIVDFLRQKTSELLESRTGELFHTIKEQYADYFSFEQIANDFLENEAEFLIEERVVRPTPVVINEEDKIGEDIWMDYNKSKGRVF